MPRVDLGNQKVFHETFYFNDSLADIKAYMVL